MRLQSTHVPSAWMPVMKRTTLPARARHVLIAVTAILSTALPFQVDAQQRSVRGWADGPYQAKGTGGSQALLFDWRFLDVYCIDMPRLHPAEDVVYGTLGGGAISYYRLRYQDGKSGLLPVLDAQRSYARARVSLAQARARRMNDVAQLLYATGRSWDVTPASGTTGG